MPSLLTTITTFLWEGERFIPDSGGLHGYNMYESGIRLQGSDIPVTIAHYTRKKKFEEGTLARVVGSGHTTGKSFLVVATSVVPLPLLPLPGPMPKDYDLLARFVFSGVVSSPYTRSVWNADAFAVNITVERPDVLPGGPLVFIAVFNRDAHRVSLNAPLAIGTAVSGRGVICGWSNSDKIIVDVHFIEYNRTGAAPKHVITDPLNPFRRVVFGTDGWPSRDVQPAIVAPGCDIMSFSNLPTRVTRQYAGADPRLRIATANNQSGSPGPYLHAMHGGGAQAPTTSVPQTAGARGPDYGAAACGCNVGGGVTCRAHLVTGWQPPKSSAPGESARQSAAATDEDAVAALLALGSAPPRVECVEVDDDGDLYESQVDPALLTVASAGDDDDDDARVLPTVQHVRDEVGREGVQSARRAYNEDDGVWTSVKRRRLIPHVTTKR